MRRVESAAGMAAQQLSTARSSWSRANECHQTPVLADYADTARLHTLFDRRGREVVIKTY